MAINRSASCSQIRILVTNDDGINSPGIKALERIANSISPDVWTVAPSMEQSGKGYSISFDSIVRLHELSPRRFSVSGTPADCVYIAVAEILKEHKPDLILSGINFGANIADYIGFSGTVGAAFAGASQGIKSIAVSQDTADEGMVKFPMAEHYLPKIIKRLMAFSWADRTCMNVNFPDVEMGAGVTVKVARQGIMDLQCGISKREAPGGRNYYWLQSMRGNDPMVENSDLELLEKKKMITITPLMSMHEHTESIKDLEELFSTNV